GQLPDSGLSAPIEYTLRYAGDEEWADAWKKHWKPVEIGRRLVIKPTWEAYEGDPHRLVIDLDPGMAFGTGGHPTTRLCRIALEDYFRPGDVEVDVGTVSGILSLAAVVLGASEVHAVVFDCLSCQ